jgi:hypothetical protein
MALRWTRLRTLTLQRTGSGPAHVAAASGLVRAGNRLYVVADDENHLAIFPARGLAPGALVRMLEGSLPRAAKKRKRRKPDFESLALLPAIPGHPSGALVALGSCSRANRCRGALATLDEAGGVDGTFAEIDLAPLRAGLEARLGSPNIEGALRLGSQLVLLHRGNKSDGRSYRIRLHLEGVVGDLARGRLGVGPLAAIEEVALGEIEGVPLCFSDGSPLPGGRMAFTAVAEDTRDSYADGACLGAAVGILDRNGRLAMLEPMPAGYKPEGIDATWVAGRFRALVVTDADDRKVGASLFRCETARS